MIVVLRVLFQTMRLVIEIMLNFNSIVRRVTVITVMVLLCPLLARAQKAYYSLKCNEDFFIKNNFNKNTCTVFTAKALSVFNTNGLCFTGDFFNEYSRTYLELLKRDYSVKTIQLSGDIVSQEEVCFNCYMSDKFEQKYGPNSLATIRHLADSLEGSGLGYFDGYLASKGDISAELMKKFKYSSHLIRSEAYGVQFSLSANNKISNVRVFDISGYKANRPVLLSKNSVYAIEVKRDLLCMQFHAATLNGQNINSELSAVLKKIYK